MDRRAGNPGHGEYRVLQRKRIVHAAPRRRIYRTSRRARGTIRMTVFTSERFRLKRTARVRVVTSTPYTWEEVNTAACTGWGNGTVDFENKDFLDEGRPRWRARLFPTGWAQCVCGGGEGNTHQ